MEILEGKSFETSDLLIWEYVTDVKGIKGSKCPN